LNRLILVSLDFLNLSASVLSVSSVVNPNCIGCLVSRH
jgi:hypothetical protein